MIRALVLALVLALLADSAFGDIGNLLSVIGLGPRVYPLGVRVPESGVSWSSPIGNGYLGYGR